ncbi:MAG: N-acyl homoserine lactonase family protein, partial [Pseudomonadota bacterium]
MSYEVYAIRYARAERKRSESFVGGDPNDGPMEMAYYVWLIRNAERAIVVDTGFGPEVAAARGREFLICPGEAIGRLGTDPASIETVVLTHLHYDHAGNHHLFPDATFHIQAAEMAYVTGAWMNHRYLRAGYGADDLKVMVDRIFAEQLVWYEGDAPLCPGIDLVHIGG